MNLCEDAPRMSPVFGLRLVNVIGNFQHKILTVSFMYTGGSGEMYHMQDTEVDTKAATWVSYTLPSEYN